MMSAMSQASLGLDDSEFGDDGEPDGDSIDGVRTLTVSQLVNEVNRALKDRFGRGIWVTGEIKGLNEGPGGHLYFDLVEEKNGKRSAVSVAFFTFQQDRLERKMQRSGIELATGIKVRIFGTLDMYAPSGRLSLKMSDIDPRFTLGELAMQREEVLRRLRESGRFDDNRSLDVPDVPLRIGLVTSVTTAAYQDFTKELGAGGVGFEVLALDVRVQGDDAPRMVAAAIRHFGGRDDIDVVVVIRGGGSKNDLAAFDSELIALAILDCEIPVFTGIGHEIDHSIADDVAHTFFKTPTAVARGLIDLVLSFSEDAESTWDEIVSAATGMLDAAGARVDGLAHRIAGSTRALVERLDERLRQRDHQVVTRARTLVDMAASRIDAMEQHIRLLDPALVLARGWSITRTATGAVVRSVADAPVGTEIITMVADGTITSTVTREG
jgi:exodeoxyribonuclease VII large subunit